jgi:serine/threonine protein kinase
MLVAAAPGEDVSSRPRASYRLRLQAVEGIERYQEHQIIGATFGRVRQTRQEELLAYAQKVPGTLQDASANIHHLPNPLHRLPEILQTPRTVKIGTIHGDLNPENILIDSEAGTVRLIDFALARKDHLLHDLMRLETGILTRFLPEEMHKFNLSAQLIYDLFVQLHAAALPTGQFGVPQELDPALKKVYVMLVTIRKVASSYLAEANQWSEYYDGLTIYLLGALKFKNLDKVETAPYPKQIAYWGAATLQQLGQEAAAYDKITWLPLSVALEEEPKAFMAPPRPAYKLVGRDEMLHNLKQRLLTGESLALVAPRESNQALNGTGCPVSAKPPSPSNSPMTKRC